MTYLSRTIAALVVLTSLIGHANAAPWVAGLHALQLTDPVDAQPGREKHDDDGYLIYELEVLTRRGIVLEIEVDARTGRILDVEEDD